MEIAALICNDKLNYESAFQIYSMYEYIKSSGNQIQVIDLNLLEDKKNIFSFNNKNERLYDFLESNVILTSKRYRSLEHFEDNPPLADKYIIANATYNDLNIETLKDNYIAYGIRDINIEEFNDIKDRYKEATTLFDVSGSQMKKVLDPIFLLSKEDWYDFSLNSSLSLENDNYILVYGETVNKDMLDYAKMLSEKNNSKIYIVSDKVQSIIYKGKRIRNALPFDIANLILNAQEVITSYNDGIKFSIIFEKALHIFYDANNEEQVELVNEYNLLNRIVNSVDKVVTNHFDYAIALSKIESIKEDTYNSLK